MIDSRIPNEKSLCGILTVRNTPTREGQTYNIDCEKYICGDKVRLDVYKEDQHVVDRSISMRDVTTYISTGR